MATVPTNLPFISYTTLDTFPLSESVSGTVSATTTATAVTGVGTAFKTDIGYSNTNDLSAVMSSESLGYLWNGTDEYRKISDVISDTVLFIESPFTVALAGATVRHIPESRAMSIGWVDATATSIGGGKVNNITLVAGEYEEGNVHEFTNNPLKPIIVDGTGGTVHVLVSYS